jgi:integrase
MKGRGDFEIVRHTVPLHPKLVAVLEEWLDELPKSRRMVFAANEDVMRSDGSLNEKANRKAADNLGQHLWRNLANTEFALVSGWHIHRHSLLTLLGEKGHTVEEAMAFVNHRTRKVAEMYRHIEQKQNPELLHGLDFTPNGVEGGVNYPVVKKEMAQKGHKSLLSQGVSNRVRTGDLRNHNPAL